MLRHEAQYRWERGDHRTGPIQFKVTSLLGHGDDAGNCHRQPVGGAGGASALLCIRPQLGIRGSAATALFTWL
jgi:hypothetical protein